MAEHPCAEGLTPECFRLYPEWAKKVAAYRFLLVAVSEDLLSKVAPWLVDIGRRPPPGWPEGEDPPEFLSRRVKVPEAVRSYGLIASHFVAPFSAGPVKRPAPAPALKEYTLEFSVNGCEFLNHVGTVWATVRNTTAAATQSLETGAYVYFTYASLSFGDYRISRVIFRIPLTALPAGAVMVSGFLKLYVSSGDGKTAGLHRADTALWTDQEDYLAFNAELDSHLTTALEYNQFPLSAASLAYCKDNAGGAVYFMTREYDHDIIDSAPAEGEAHWSRCANYGNTTPEYRPILSLTYKA